MKQNTLFLSLIIVTLSFNLFAQKPPSNTEDEPPQPTEGVCFAKSVTPDKFKVVEEQMLVAPAKTTEEFIDAVYDTVKQQIYLLKRVLNVA